MSQPVTASLLLLSECPKCRKIHSFVAATMYADLPEEAIMEAFRAGLKSSFGTQPCFRCQLSGQPWKLKGLTSKRNLYTAPTSSVKPLPASAGRGSATSSTSTSSPPPGKKALAAKA